MLLENEVVTLILGIGVFFMLLMNLEHIKKIRSWKILSAAYFMLLAAWIFTVLEGFFLEPVLNILEHTCYLASAVLMAIWCWKSAGKPKEEEAV